MSRSYKKNPYCKDGSVWHKRQANKKVRKYKGELKSGMLYKRVYEQYDICDWKWHETLPQALARAKELSEWAKNWDWAKGYNPVSWEYDEKKEIRSWKKFHYWK